VAEAPAEISLQDTRPDDGTTQLHAPVAPHSPLCVRHHRPRWTRPRTWPQQWLNLIAYWCASRLVMLALLRKGTGDIAVEVHELYHHWSRVLVHGTFPIGDVTWQYPPGAALVMAAPALVPVLSYLQAFVLLMFAADALTLLALLRAGTGRPGRSTAGAWFWALGLPLMLQLSYARYDLLVTAIAVLGLLAVPGRPLCGGALIGLGAVIKVWPALTVLGTPRGRTTRHAWAAVLTSAGAIFLLLATAFRGALDFLSAQHHRGVEIESLGGMALNLARLLGWPGRVELRYGSMEYLGPYVSSVANASLALTALSFAWLLFWRLRACRWSPATPYDAALTAVLLFTVTSRVISPQYLVWLVGLGAVCLTVRRTTQRPVAIMLLLAAAVTAVDFPLFFGAVIHSSWQGFVVLALRNGLLMAAALLSCARLWRAARQGEPERVTKEADACRSTVAPPPAGPTAR
jgi:hypothetical protein